MCGGKQQEVVQKVELDPALQRYIYGGTLANPRTSLGSSQATPLSTADTAAQDFMDRARDAGGMADGFSGSEPSYGDVGPVSGSGGLYANGGYVQPQQGLASLNRGQMPMMRGQMPNLSDPMTAAALAMAVRQPELRYGSVMSAQHQRPMRQPVQQPMGYKMGGYVEGPGTGRSDDIEAQIYQDGVPVQEARLSDGEFVMTERAVKGAGGGDREAGAARMYEMMRRFERGGRA